MIDKKQYFQLYANCVATAGASRGSIVDLQRHELYFVPNAMLSLLADEFAHYTIEEVLMKFDDEEQEIIMEYIEYVLDNELGFLAGKKERTHFPALPLEWKMPSVISNAIIELNDYIIKEYKGVIQELSAFNCKLIQLHGENIASFENLENIVRLVTEETTASIELIIPYRLVGEKDKLENLLWHFQTINSIIVYNSPDKDEQRIAELAESTIIYVKENLKSYQYCGLVNQQYFAMNIPHYTESLAHNSCLNRKISIDAEGNIKNCPSMKESYGNIKDTSLEEALNHPDFKQYWNITKDEISKCRDCEFRHVCTDCRAFIENPEDKYSAPLKCGYDPYTNEWEEWSTNPLKQKAIDHYGLREILPNEDKQKKD